MNDDKAKDGTITQGTPINHKIARSALRGERPIEGCIASDMGMGQQSEVQRLTVSAGRTHLYQR